MTMLEWDEFAQTNCKEVEATLPNNPIILVTNVLSVRYNSQPRNSSFVLLKDMNASTQGNTIEMN